MIKYEETRTENMPIIGKTYFVIFFDQICLLEFVLSYKSGTKVGKESKNHGYNDSISQYLF